MKRTLLWYKMRAEVAMKPQASSFALLFVLITGCGGSTQTSCTITANISPASATADHALAAPGNQVQFTTQSSVAGNCPLAADVLGTWATSDTTNTAINQQGMATCLNATSSPATITNSGKIRSTTGFTSASLVCH